MTFPPAGWKPPAQRARPLPLARGAAATADFTSREMLRTPQYWMLLVAFAFSACAGLMAVGLLRLFPTEALSGAMRASANAAGLPVDETAIRRAAGMIACNAVAFFFCFGNGLGRLLWGVVSDTLGRRRSIVAMLLMQMVMMFAFPRMASSEVMLYAGALLVGFNFGGNFSLFPAVTADLFGARHVGQNYGWVYLAYGLGGIAGPVMGGRLGDLGNFPLAFTICGVLCLVAAVVAARLKPTNS
jgi:OFA family oxalate/formate antiporter-like MFS transporter